MAIRIISDTSCDLTQELIEKYQLVILPLCVLDDEREYVNTVDITNRSRGRARRPARAPRAAAPRGSPDGARR